MYFKLASFELNLSWDLGKEGKSEESNATCRQTKKKMWRYYQLWYACRYVKKVTPSTVVLLCSNLFKKKKKACTDGYTFVVKMYNCVRKIILNFFFFFNQKTKYLIFCLLASDSLSKPKFVSVIYLHVLTVFPWHQGQAWIRILQWRDWMYAISEKRITGTEYFVETTVVLHLPSTNFNIWFSLAN